MELHGEMNTGVLDVFWDNGHVVELQIRNGRQISGVRLGPREVIALREWLFVTTTTEQTSAGAVEAAYTAQAGKAFLADDDPLRAVSERRRDSR